MRNCKTERVKYEAKKYVDRVCIELGKKQVYNTFKAI